MGDQLTPFLPIPSLNSKKGKRPVRTPSYFGNEWRLLIHFFVGHYDWDNIEHRREFLSGYAKKMHFDPRVSTNWRTRLPSLRAYGVRTMLSSLALN